jgi:hypothetical protein
MSFELVTTAILALLAFAALAGMSGWIATTPTLAATVIFVLIFLEALNIPIAFSAGLSIYPEDIFFGMLAIACVIRFTLFASPASVPWVWWLIGAIQVVLAVWGLKTIGTLAGVDYRAHFYLWVSVAYFCSFQWSDEMIDKIIDIWIAGSVCLCMLVIYRWVNSLLDPLYEQEIMAHDTTGVRFRVIGSGSTLAIALGTIGVLFRLIRGAAPAAWILLPLQLMTIAILQHRSVWVATFLGAGCLLLGMRGRMKPGSIMALGALLAIPLLILVMLPGDNSMVSSMKGSADRALNMHEGTMVGRVVTWDDLLDKWIQTKSLVIYLIGWPYGSEFHPFELADGTMMDMVPHNHLLQILARGGVIGVAATLWLFCRLWKSGLDRAQQDGASRAPYLFAVLSASYAYYIPYWAAYGTGIFLGIAISYLGVAGRQARPAPTATVATGFAERRLPAFRARR